MRPRANQVRVPEVSKSSRVPPRVGLCPVSRRGVLPSPVCDRSEMRESQAHLRRLGQVTMFAAARWLKFLFHNQSTFLKFQRVKLLQMQSMIARTPSLKNCSENQDFCLF